MDKDIQEIRRRAGLNLVENEPVISTQDQAELYGGYQEGSPNVLTNKDKRYIASKVITLQKRHRDWKSLNRALVEMILAEMERMYDEGYQDGRYEPHTKESLGEIEGSDASKAQIDRIRRVYNIPDHVEDKDVMKWYNQHMAKTKVDTQW